MSNPIKTMNIMKTYLYTTIVIIATAICMTSNLYAADAPVNIKMKSTSLMLNPTHTQTVPTYQKKVTPSHATSSIVIRRTSEMQIQSVGGGFQYGNGLSSIISNGSNKKYNNSPSVPSISVIPLPQRVKKIPLAAAEGTIMADEQLALNRIAPRQNARGEEGEEGDIIDDPIHTPDPNQPLPAAIGYLLLLSIMYILKRKCKKTHVHEA